MLYFLKAFFALWQTKKYANLNIMILLRQYLINIFQDLHRQYVKSILLTECVYRLQNN